MQREDIMKNIKVTYEHTIATAQFENLKPKIECEVEDWKDVSQALQQMRAALAYEHKQIKSKEKK
jgi:inorganic pyrophosphatase